MAIKKPLVETAGLVQEIPANDYIGVPSLSIGAGATTPDPGGTSARGVTVWSTLENTLLRWGGTNWDTIESVTDTMGDPDYAKVSLLLHCNGINGSTTFTDNSSYGHVFAANGNAQVSTAQSKFGGASGLFDGAGDFLTLAAHPSFEFGSSDFCVEVQLYPTNASAGTNFFGNLYQAIFGQFQFQAGGDPSAGILVYLENLKVVVQPRIGGSFPFVLADPSALPLNTWSHIAVTRSGSSFRLFVNGVQVAVVTNAGSIDVSTRPVRIGADALSAGNFQGHIDELRVTKGAARYTATFTPPSTAFSDNPLVENGAKITIGRSIALPYTLR